MVGWLINWSFGFESDDDDDDEVIYDFDRLVAWRIILFLGEIYVSMRLRRGYFKSITGQWNVRMCKIRNQSYSTTANCTDERLILEVPVFALHLQPKKFPGITISKSFKNLSKDQ